MSETELPFATYPVRPASFAASLSRTVVIAPHPDDEALGSSGLLALLHRAGQPTAAVLVSDGTMSHPRSRLFSAEARQVVREAEFGQALSILGAAATVPLLLRLPDSTVPRRAAPGAEIGGPAPHPGRRGVGAVVGQHNYLEAARGQGLTVQGGLGGQGRQRGGQIGHFVLGWDDDAGAQFGAGWRQLPQQLGGASAAAGEREPPGAAR